MPVRMAGGGWTCDVGVCGRVPEPSGERLSALDGRYRILVSEKKSNTLYLTVSETQPVRYRDLLIEFLMKLLIEL